MSKKVSVLVVGNNNFSKMVEQRFNVSSRLGVADLQILSVGDVGDAHDILLLGEEMIDAIFVQGDNPFAISLLRSSGFGGHFAAFGGESMDVDEAHKFDVVLHNDTPNGITQAICLLLQYLNLTSDDGIEFMPDDEVQLVEDEGWNVDSKVLRAIGDFDAQAAS